MSRFRPASADNRAGLAIPYILLVIFILMDNAAFGIMASSRLELGLYFVPLFFIGLTAESDSTPIILAALGLVNDVSNEMPLGFYAALFVIFYLLCVGQRSILATATFGAYWVMFALLSVLIHVAAYILALLLSDVHMVVSSLFLSALACCTVFPVIYLPFELLGGAIGSSEKH